MAETIEDLIRRAGEKGLSVVMATHNLDKARRLASRVGVLVGGEMVQAGSQEEIFERPGSEEVARFVRARSGW